jgi:hypothetical protein
MFYSVSSSLAAGKMRQILLSLAASDIILWELQALPVCIFRVKIATLVSNF